MHIVHMRMLPLLHGGMHMHIMHMHTLPLLHGGMQARRCLRGRGLMDMLCT